MIKLIAKQMVKFAILLGFVVFVVALFSPVQAAEATPAVTLQDSLVSIIQQVQSGVSAGVSFLSAEIPDVIKQLLLWKFAEALAWTFASSLLIFQFFVVLYYGVKWFKSATSADEAVVSCIVMVVSGIVAIVATTRTFANGLEALQIYIAPKVWLIEYAASLVK